MSHTLPDFDTFQRSAAHANLLPMFRRLMSDTLTPVLAYRRLVGPDDRLAPSFLFESVVDPDHTGRYSYLGSQPAAEVLAYSHQVRYTDHRHPEHSRQYHSPDPLREMNRITADWHPAPANALPDFAGGWVGLAGYDTVRYLEGEKLSTPPPDDRHLPDLHMALYLDLVAFDHVRKVLLVITHVSLDEHDSLPAAYDAGRQRLDSLVQRLSTPHDRDGHRHAPGETELPPGELDLDSPPPPLGPSNMGSGGYQQAVAKAKTYIAAGDIFQVVPSQRFELHTNVDPFDIYRALRVVNPSPYMFYLQVPGAILVGSSPEILCRVHDGQVTSRPLAGTRPRGHDTDEDRALEAELLADPKERAEHVMLVDLGRNDVGRVTQLGSIQLPQLMAVERYSHVMHLSSTVTGRLAPSHTCWDVLRSTLPVGTVSGAPKVRAMQIIDELEPTRRGPYAGAVGHADFLGNMDMAIALRTMVITPPPPPPPEQQIAAQPPGSPKQTTPPTHRHSPWTVHIQVGGGIVADSQPDAEHEETLNKAAAMAKAVELARHAFGADHP